MRRDDLTICTAATADYAEKVVANVLRWLETPGLMEQRFTLFCVDCSHDLPAFDPIRNHVKLVQYGRPPGVTIQREAALSAFVFGAAACVETPYWMKCDGDVRPLGPLVWPRYDQHTITGDSWHFSKTKPREVHPLGHVLNRLDAWWGDKPLFPQMPADAVYRHKRLRSFAWIERTDFTRRLAEKCGTRMPVPSQDTLGFYVATRWGEPWQAYPFRNYLRPA